jgi:hypothetical protein
VRDIRLQTAAFKSRPPPLSPPLPTPLPTPLSLPLPLHIVGPLLMKQRMYVLFLLLVLAFMAAELLTHSLLFTENNVTVALLFFEFAEITIVSLIGFFFRPREFSPFFFMVSTSMRDRRSRPVPIVEVYISVYIHDIFT